MNQIGITRVAHLPLVLERREDVRPPQQLEVRLGAVALTFSRRVSNRIILAGV